MKRTFTAKATREIDVLTVGEVMEKLQELPEDTPFVIFSGGEYYIPSLVNEKLACPLNDDYCDFIYPGNVEEEASDVFDAVVVTSDS